MAETQLIDFPHLIDLCSDRIGGRAVSCSDDFFAPKEAMLREGRGEFVAGKYTENGKWMDGWESRRRRDGGHDWCIIRLGLPGAIHGVDVDCNHFLGNAPKSCRIEGAHIEGYRSAVSLGEADVRWTELLVDSPTSPGAQNLFSIVDRNTYTHLRLHIYPDGGVARFRAYGEARPNWKQLLEEHRVLDLAAVEHGGVALAASDEFFSNKQNLIMPGPSTHMGDGWESRRRRGPGHDWVIVRLGRAGRLRRVVIDTSHFKGNFPDRCVLEGTQADAGTSPDELVDWRPLVASTKLEMHTPHTFPISDRDPVTHVRLSIFPDGGVARLRVFGEPVA